MKRYILDTNHISEAVGRVSVVRDRIQWKRRQGHVFASCGPVLCELMAGISVIADAAQSQRRLAELLQIVCIRPITLETANRYAVVFHELRRKRRVLSQVDLLIAAMGHQYDTTLLTSDRAFEALPDISVENWLIT